MDALKLIVFGRTPLAVARSLRDDPSKWAGTWHPWMGRYCKLRHSSGLEVWTANSAYGIDVSAPNTPTWGGVTFLSSVGLSPGHWLIFAACKRWIRNHAPSASSILNDREAA